MEEKAFFDELERLLKDIPSEDKEKIISTWKEKWASVQNEKEVESFLTPQEIAQQYFTLHNEDVGRPSTCEFHPSLQVEEEKKENNEKEVVEDSQNLTQNNQEMKEKDTEAKKEHKAKKRKPLVLILTFPLWILFLGLVLFVALLFTLGYGAFFIGVISVILYALFTLVTAVFQGMNAQIFPALFQGGVGILLALIAVLSVAGMNAFIKILWKGFRKAYRFVFIGGKSK